VLVIAISFPGLDLFLSVSPGGAVMKVSNGSNRAAIDVRSIDAFRRI